MPKKETLLATLGLSPEIHSGAVNVPPYRASTILFPTLADFDAGERGEYPHSTYGRYGTPSTEALEATLAALMESDHVIATSSGLSAITVALMAFVKSGDHVLMPDSLYGPARRFCNIELKRLGVEIEYYDPLVGAAIAPLIRKNTSVVYLESPGSLTFEVQDVPAIAKAAHDKGCIIIADDTWATPLYTKSFSLGVDVSIHAATKYISGHSDLVMGAVAYRKEHHERMLTAYRNYAPCPSADNCYLALRGLRTLALRVRQQFASAMIVAGWLEGRAEVEKVLFPALPGAPGHELWKRDFTGASSLFSLALKPVARPQLAAMLDGMEFFGMGYSWGGFESLATPFSPRKIRTASQWPYSGDGLRLHIGLEHPDDLIADLEKGFARMKKAA